MIPCYVSVSAFLLAGQVGKNHLGFDRMTQKGISESYGIQNAGEVGDGYRNRTAFAICPEGLHDERSRRHDRIQRFESQGQIGHFSALCGIFGVADKKSVGMPGLAVDCGAGERIGFSPYGAALDFLRADACVGDLFVALHHRDASQRTYIAASRIFVLLGNQSQIIRTHRCELDQKASAGKGSLVVLIDVVFQGTARFLEVAKEFAAKSEQLSARARVQEKADDARQTAGAIDELETIDADVAEDVHRNRKTFH